MKIITGLICVGQSVTLYRMPSHFSTHKFFYKEAAMFRPANSLPPAPPVPSGKARVLHELCKLLSHMAARR